MMWRSVCVLLVSALQESQRTENELWDFLERIAMEVLMMRLEEGLVSDEGIDAGKAPRTDWAWDPPEGLH